MYPSDLIEETVMRLLRDAQVDLPKDVQRALGAALQNEDSEIARSQLLTIMENVEKAKLGKVPMCQDTGLPIFFVRGKVNDTMGDAIRRGVVKATKTIPLRPNVVDPLTRHNTGDNIGNGVPSIHFEPGKLPYLEISVLVKGAGSENWSTLRMLNPADGLTGVRDFVIESVVRAGSRPCPPIVVGVGIGGTADQACLMAKRSLMRSLEKGSEDDTLKALESRLSRDLNSLGIGPMGLGGRTTVLGVAIEKADCHTASLPVAVSINCWASRRASAKIFPDGRVVFSQEGSE